MRERLRADGFFFAMLVIMLWLANFLLAVTWYYFRDPVLAVASAACFALVAYLFRYRQSRAR